MKIYLIPYKELEKRGIDAKPSTPHEWNKLETLPISVKKLLRYCQKNGLVFTPEYFTNSFNLQEPETYHGDYLMFIPDEKFSI